jgi:hypothetical protein
MAGVQGKNPGTRAGELSGFLLFLVLSMPGCAELSSIFSPPPSKVPPPPMKSVTPPPVLSPQMGQAEEERQRQETNGKIQKAEQTVQQVDQSKLAKDQQETYATVRSFIGNAREALSARDFVRASNLAEKAQLLADDLLRSTPR